VPIFGFTKAMIKPLTAKQTTPNLREDLKKDPSGLNRFKTAVFPNDFWVLFFQKKVHKNSANINGMIKNTQNQNFSSN
jgi:hypothetical protein